MKDTHTHNVHKSAHVLSTSRDDTYCDQVLAIFAFLNSEQRKFSRYALQELCPLFRKLPLNNASSEDRVTFRDTFLVHKTRQEEDQKNGNKLVETVLAGKLHFLPLNRIDRNRGGSFIVSRTPLFWKTAGEMAIARSYLTFNR